MNSRFDFLSFYPTTDGDLAQRQRECNTYERAGSTWKAVGIDGAKPQKKRGCNNGSLFFLPNAASPFLTIPDNALT